MNFKPKLPNGRPFGSPRQHVFMLHVPLFDFSLRTYAFCVFAYCVLLYVLRFFWLLSTPRFSKKIKTQSIKIYASEAHATQLLIRTRFCCCCFKFLQMPCVSFLHICHLVRKAPIRNYVFCSFFLRFVATALFSLIFG